MTVATIGIKIDPTGVENGGRVWLELAAKKIAREIEEAKGLRELEARRRARRGR